MGAMQAQCPACGDTIPIAVEARATAHTAEALVITVEPDLTDVMAHAWAHEE